MKIQKEFEVNYYYAFVAVASSLCLCLFVYSAALCLSLSLVCVLVLCMYIKCTGELGSLTLRVQQVKSSGKRDSKNVKC